jgi:hypothetical protein
MTSTLSGAKASVNFFMMLSFIVMISGIAAIAATVNAADVPRNVL